MTNINFKVYGLQVVPTGDFYTLHYNGCFSMWQALNVILFTLKLRLWRKGIIMNIPLGWRGSMYVGKVRKAEIDWMRKQFRLEIELMEDADGLPKRSIK